MQFGRLLKKGFTKHCKWRKNIGMEFSGILEEVTKASLEKLVGKIMALATQNSYYEFVPGFYLVDNQYLIEYQKNKPNNPLIYNRDFNEASFYIMQTEPEDIKPCNDPLDIAEIILMTEGLGNEAEDSACLK